MEGTLLHQWAQLCCVGLVIVALLLAWFQSSIDFSFCYSQAVLCCRLGNGYVSSVTWQHACQEKGAFLMFRLDQVTVVGTEPVIGMARSCILAYTVFC